MNCAWCMVSCTICSLFLSVEKAVKFAVVYRPLHNAKFIFSFLYFTSQKYIYSIIFCLDQVIPKRYASAHFPLESQTITLQRQGKNKKWYPMFYIRKDGSGYMLYGCWKKFVRDNHVKEGDMCIFHLTKFTGGEFGATVHLLRETKSGSLGSFHTSHKRFDLRDGRTWPKVTGVRRVSSRPYLTADRVSLTEEQVRKVEEVVHSIQSEGPMYVSIMNKSNVGTDGLYIIVSLAISWTHFHYYLAFIITTTTCQ